jgi:hypothetical protein
LAGLLCSPVFAVWQLRDSQTFLFVSGMTIDADGVPNAYHPDDTGLDELTELKLKLKP